MDGIHDLGGMQGFGPVSKDPHEHATWEIIPKVLLYIGAAKLKKFNVDQYRHAIERIVPLQYLAESYFERSLTGLASLYVETGVLDHRELEERAGGRWPLSLPVGPGREPPPPPEFLLKVGDRVKTRNIFVSGHVRMPAYARGKCGVVIERDIDIHYPDAVGNGIPSGYVPTFHVEFLATELWADAEPGATLVMSLCQDYLEQVES
ncbi:SH3-like domain-containing protein [Pandoraea cepalis]|uniref:nitrile hydratase n=1 Tax=Pandoraea cepalis TaxID=2508294 RepID=A0A5E4VP97_9BURK|nr:SH3-like domain-containing protein [Pandoraea cepalis]VVE13753.1 low-molecular weight cobalt-containing nitrile hydratase subunit beta [Pandoraea cepalis]